MESVFRLSGAVRRDPAVEAWFDCAWYSILGTWSTIDRFLSAEYGITPEQLADWREFYLE